MSVNRSTRREYMYSKIREQSQVRESQSVFCQREGISLHSFRYWKHKFESSSGLAAGGGKFLPVSPSCTFASSGAIIEIIYPHGVIVRLPVISESLLTTLINLPIS